MVVAYTGAVAPEAIAAVGLLAEDRRDVGLLAVTSADRLNAGWTAAQRARERGLVHARSHIERLLAEVPSHCGIVSVLRRTSRDARLARRRARPSRARARRGAFRPDRLASRTSIATTASTPNAIVAAAGALTPGPADPAISRRCRNASDIVQTTEDRKSGAHFSAVCRLSSVGC